MCGFYKPFFLLLLLIMVNACGGNDAAVNDRATPDPTLPTPVPLLAKEPLAGDVAAIPEVLIVGAGQSRYIGGDPRRSSCRWGNACFGGRRDWAYCRITCGI